MADPRFKFFLDSQSFDLDLKNWELEFDDGLETAVLVSLFTDARVTEEELPIGEVNRRGFWGDAVENEGSVPTGSKLWLAERAKVTDELLEQVRDSCLEALQWLIDDGIASDVTVETEYNDQKWLLISIEITRPSGQKVGYKFDYVWIRRSGGIQSTYT